MAVATRPRWARTSWLLRAQAQRALGSVAGNLANILTLSRLVCAVPLYILISTGNLHIAFWIFLLSALTDVADGFVAKHLGSTNMGALLDPISDKAFLGCLFLGLLSQGAVPLSLVALIITRDILIVAGTGLLRVQLSDLRIEPLVVGKLSTFVQLLLVGTLLAGLAGIADTAGPSAMLLVATYVLTAGSTAAYLMIGLRLLHQVKPSRG